MTTTMRRMRERCDEFTATQYMVAFVVVSLGDTQTGEIPRRIRPTPDDLTRMMPLGRSAIYSAVKALTDAGWIARDYSDDPRGPISAALVPGGEPEDASTSDDSEDRTQSTTRTENDLRQSTWRTEDDHASPPHGLASPPHGLDQSTTRTDTYIHGTLGPLGTNTVGPSDFVAFWAAYPRKVDKGHARMAWAEAIKKAEAAIIIAGATKFSAYCANARTQSHYIPHATTWLKGERWGDDLKLGGPATSNGHHPYRNPTDASAYEGDL